MEGLFTVSHNSQIKMAENGLYPQINFLFTPFFGVGPAEGLEIYINDFNAAMDDVLRDILDTLEIKYFEIYKTVEWSTIETAIRQIIVSPQSVKWCFNNKESIRAKLELLTTY